MKTKTITVVTSEGDLTIEKISGLKDEIYEKSKHKKKVVIEIDKLKDIDLAGLQLLISIKKYHPNIECKIDRVSKIVEDILENTGLKNLVK